MSSSRELEHEANEKLLRNGNMNNASRPNNNHTTNHNSSSNNHHNNHGNNLYGNINMSGKHYPDLPASQSRVTHRPASATTASTPDMVKDLSLETKQDLERQLQRLAFYLKALGVVCLIFFLIVLVTFCVLMVRFRYDLDHHEHRPGVGHQVSALLQQQSMCVPCSGIVLGPSVAEERKLRQFSIKDASSGPVCCVDTSQQLLDLLQLFVERRFREEMAKGTVQVWHRGTGTADGQKQTVGAHLIMTRQDMNGISQVRGRQYTIGKWIHKHDTAFQSGTTYREGRIVIPYDGFYYVYSQISFTEYFNDEINKLRGSGKSTDSPSLSIYLYRYNIHYAKGGEERLAQNSMTKCWGQSSEVAEYSTSIGVVLYLRNQDEIFVKVSNISLVSPEHKLSYFGLFQV